MCLEVPEEVVPKDEDDEDVELYGKRPRLSLIPPRTMAQDGKRNKGIMITTPFYCFPIWQPRLKVTIYLQRYNIKCFFFPPLISFTGPPKLVVTPTKLTLMDPFHRGLNQSSIDGGRPPHYTKTRAPAISSQSKPRNGHLSVSVSPTWTEVNSAQPARKMGVASLLFHKTLSPKDALQVHSFNLEKQRQPHTQLQVHSYAREHQPRHLLHKTCTLSHMQVQPSSRTPGCETMAPKAEPKTILTKVAQNEPEAQKPVVQDKVESKPQMSIPVEDQAETKKAEVKSTVKSVPSQSETQPQDLIKVNMEASKNSKRKVSVFHFKDKDS